MNFIRQLLIISCCIWQTDMVYAANHVKTCLDSPMHLKETPRQNSYFHLQLNAGQYCYSNQFKYTNDADYSRLNRIVGAVLTPVAAKRLTLESQLNQTWQAAVAELAQAENLTVTDSSMNLDGPLEFRIQGNPDGAGEIIASVGGFTLTAFASVKKNSLLRASIRVTVDPILLSGKYQVSTGLFSQLQFQRLNVNVRLDVDSVLDLIPGVNAKVTQKIESKVAQALSFGLTTQLQMQAGNYSKVLLGLDQQLPSGTFMLNGQDYGVVVKDALNTAISGLDIKVSVGNASTADAVLALSLPRQGIVLTAGYKVFPGWNSCRVKFEDLIKDTNTSIHAPLCN
ncbi:hypothetical protein [Rheinheimera texasensis]|uniref:hypothetical protein n=1 Tax=Rheinheimera texasensis TaxID=306205 RepID=UPI0032B2EAA6